MTGREAPARFVRVRDPGASKGDSAGVGHLVMGPWRNFWPDGCHGPGLMEYPSEEFREFKGTEAAKG